MNEETLKMREAFIMIRRTLKCRLKMSDKYDDASMTDEDLNTIKQDFIEAKKQGIVGGYLIELPYRIGQKGEIKEWVSVDIFPDFESKRAKLVFSDNFW